MSCIETKSINNLLLQNNRLDATNFEEVQLKAHQDSARSRLN